MLLQRNYQDFSSYFQGVYIRFARILQGILKNNFKDFSVDFQGLFKGFSRNPSMSLQQIFTVFFKILSKTFQDIFQESFT